MRIRLFFLLFSLLTATNTSAGEVFETVDRALLHPLDVTTLALANGLDEDIHLPEGICSFSNMRTLDITCYESLEDLPHCLGGVANLEEIVIDNGSGCTMNIQLPESIGGLQRLKILRLIGAIDPRGQNSRILNNKPLPQALGKLANLEELDLSRNALPELPPQTSSLYKLRMLVLDHNEIHLLPAFVGELKNLQLLSLKGNGGVKLPEALAALSGLKIMLGNNRLTKKDQLEMQARFPRAAISFVNEYDDDNANE